ncbi:MAG: DNA repair protein RadA [Sphaerochaetaceae bacterium]|jgi:DNA repair protein RadA/Sms|nr:DNA repair protein RadA [Sphaerochaetaceae bacterium]
MKENKVVFECSKCGFQSPKWLGRCPDCGNWNTFTQQSVSPVKPTASVVASTGKVASLDSIEVDAEYRFSSGLSEFDRVLGGGIVKASSVLLGGEPGIGKSTLMLQVLSSLKDKKALYVSGEESAQQIKQRSMRLGLEVKDIDVFCETSLENILHAIQTTKPQILVIDSLQTVTSPSVGAVIGSASHIKACAFELINECKSQGCTVFFIGHVTKEGLLAGPKVIEHLVDTVLYFEEGASSLRLIRAAKNRFGSVDEIGFFLMEDKGLTPVKDPSGFFLCQREEGPIPAGIAFSAVSEGTRVFLVEIQALVVASKSAYGRIFAERMDNARVSRIAAVLERHGGIQLADKDIYINLAGGIRVSDVAMDLALALAIWSAVAQRSLPQKTASFGELSLAGEVRPVGLAQRRMKAVKEMGFVACAASPQTPKETGVKLISCSSIQDALKILKFS